MTPRLLTPKATGAVALALLLLALPAQSFAQDQDSESEGGIVNQIANNVLSSTTVIGLLGTTTIGAPITTTSSAFNRNQPAPPTERRDQVDPERERKRRERRNQQVQLIIRADGPAIQHAIATGGGEVTADLAVMFNVPAEHQARFVQVLKDNRDQLTPLLDSEDVSSERTEDFMLTIERAMAVDNELAIYLHELMVWEVG